MPANQLLSADPKAGQLLSSDPQAGLAAPVGVHPEATIHAPTATEPVTLGDLMDSPVEAVTRIGALLKRDASDPKTWLTLVGAYFGPKVMNRMMPSLGNSLLKGAEQVGRVRMNPGVSVKMSPMGVALRPSFGFSLAPSAEAAPAPPTIAMPAPVAPEAVPTAIPAPAGPRTINEAMQAAIAKLKPAAAEPTPAPEVAPAKPAGAALNEVQAAVKGAKIKLTAAETKTAMEMVQRGRSPSEALDAIQQLREFQQKFNTPSSEAVRSAVKARNAAGEWSGRPPAPTTTGRVTPVPATTADAPTAMPGRGSTPQPTASPAATVPPKPADLHLPGGDTIAERLRAKIASERRNYELTGQPWNWDFKTNQWTPGGWERVMNDLPYHQTEALMRWLEATLSTP